MCRHAFIADHQRRGGGCGARWRAARRGGVLTLDLRAAQPWRSGLDTLQLDFCRAPVAQAYCAAWSALDANGRGDTILPAQQVLYPLTCWTRRRDGVMSPPENTLMSLSSVLARAGRQRVMTSGRRPRPDGLPAMHAELLRARWAGAQPLAAHTEHSSCLSFGSGELG